MPQGRARSIVHTARAQRRRERPAGEIIRSKRGARISKLDRPIDLAARRTLLVDQHGFEPELVSERGSGHAGGTCADDRELDRHPVVGMITRAPIWRLGTPSISARQSKQTPVMQ